MKVFLVEDAIAIRDRIRTTIEKIGGVVVGEASSEKEAINSLVGTGAEVAVIDLHLSEGNGIDVIRQIKKVGPNIILIVMTDHGDRIYEESCIAAGADFFMVKAADYSRFETLIESFLRVIGKISEGMKCEQSKK